MGEWQRCSECNPQRIGWRPVSHEELQHFRFNIVAYGTASARFLAFGSLQLAAKDFEYEYPVLSKPLVQEFYVND